MSEVKCRKLFNFSNISKAGRNTLKRCAFRQLLFCKWVESEEVECGRIPYTRGLGSKVCHALTELIVTWHLRQFQVDSLKWIRRFKTSFFSYIFQCLLSMVSGYFLTHRQLYSATSYDNSNQNLRPLAQQDHHYHCQSLEFERWGGQE